MRQRSKIAGSLLYFFLVSWLGSTTVAATISGFAAMGASETQGTTYSGSWVPYLAIDRSLNFGPGQSYNRAIGGSTTTSLLSAGQHTQVASLVQNGSVDVAYMFIGGLDVPPVAAQMIVGTLNVPTWANGVVSRMMTAVDAVLAKHPEGMVVAGLPDMTLVPGASSYLSVPGLAQPVINAIDYVNSLIKSEVLERNLVYLDTASAMRDLFASPFVVGGVPIDLTTGSSTTTHFFVDDIHPGAVGNGYFANLMLAALNKGFGTNLAPFSDQLILAKAGLSARYTGQTSNINYSQYVYVSAVPEPATFVQAAIFSAAVLAYGLRRRRTRSNIR